LNHAKFFPEDSKGLVSYRLKFYSDETLRYPCDKA